jgi:hypothetical protein
LTPALFDELQDRDVWIELNPLPWSPGREHWQNDDKAPSGKKLSKQERPFVMSGTFATGKLHRCRSLYDPAGWKDAASAWADYSLANCRFDGDRVALSELVRPK